MTNALAHRGPNAEGYFIEPGIALGHRRLSIIDLSTSADQPMIDVSGRYVLVFNGEIYNYKEIKPLLPEYAFRTGSDSEVILAAYSCWGADCLQHLNGMFAFAIWDKSGQELFVARDRLGVKPLYYYSENEIFIFASEIRAILASELVPRRLNPVGMQNYFMYQSVSAPNTILKNVQRLMPGEYGIFKAGVFQKKYYWEIGKPSTAVHHQNNPAPAFEDKATVHRNIRRLLTESVERRMISDVPLGAFLSGGIDSSAVVGLMAECSEEPVNTFSINFTEKEYDESRYSTLIAKRFNTRHTPILLRPEDFLEALPEALQAMDSPSGDGFNTWLVSKKTKEAGITVALSGIGGDELFAGYSTFLRWLHLHKSFLWRLPVTIRRPVAMLMHKMGHDPKFERLSNLVAIPNPSINFIYPSFRQVLPSDQAVAIISGNSKPYPDSLQELLTARLSTLSKLPLLSQYTAAELLGYTLNVLLKDTDQMSMASALEVREPFFDYKLVEYVLQIPDVLKYPRYPKSLLVESLAPLLPDEIVHRPKMGFALPWKHWLRRELREWCELKLKNLADRPSFNGKVIWELSHQFFRGNKSDNWMQVFQMAVLEDWLERNSVE